MVTWERDSNRHGARPVHQIISMIKRIRTSCCQSKISLVQVASLLDTDTISTDFLNFNAAMAPILNARDRVLGTSELV